MVRKGYDHSAFSRLENIYEEIAVIQNVIVSNLPHISEQPELVEKLIRRCDELGMELDRLRSDLRIHSSVSSSPKDGRHDPSASGSGLRA